MNENGQRHDTEKETHRSRPAFGRDQQGIGAGEIHSPRAPEHAAHLVGAAAARGGTGRDLRADGRRPVEPPGAFPHGGSAGEGAPAALPAH